MSDPKSSIATDETLVPAGRKLLDLLVVGGGPAGTAAAFRARELGLRVAVVDRDDVLTRIRDYAKAKAILPDFGGGDKMAFPDGGPLVKDLHFEPIDKDAMHAHWKALYARHSVPASVGVELVGLDRESDEAWRARVWNTKTKVEESIRARHVVLALGGGMPRRLDIPGDVKSIATRLDDAAAYVGAPVCVIGGGTSSAEAVIAISHAKTAAADASPVCWAYRGTTLPAVSRALADELFTAYTQNGNVRYLPGGEPVSVSTRSDRPMLCVEVDRKELLDRPAEILHLEFSSAHCIACIGQEIPEKFLAGLGVSPMTGGPRNKRAFVVSPLLETVQRNLYLIGDTISPLYLEADDFEADPAQFREIKRRGNVKAALRDGVLVAEVIAQKQQGRTNIRVNVSRDVAAPSAATPPVAVAEDTGRIVRPGAVPDRRGASLVELLQGGAVEAEEFALKPDGVTTIGRRNCDVSFPEDSLLADRHATVSGVGDGYVLRGETSDGVFLRVAASRPTDVKPGAVISAGRQWIVVDRPGEAAFTHYASDGRAAKRYTLTEGVTMSLGREAEVSLDPADGTLSRRHMSISLRQGVVVIRDLKSVNGTFLMVVGERRLQDGDEVLLGSQMLRFSVARESRPVAVVFEAPTSPAIVVPPAVAAAPLVTPGAPAAPVAPVAPTGAAMVEFAPLGKRCAIAKGQSICELAEAQGVRIKAQCHEGKCGSDPIRIVAGAEHLNTMTETESATIEELGLEPGPHRLACVTRATGSVTVELLDPA